MTDIKKGSTDRSVELYIVDDTDGTPELGVLFNTAGVDLNYRRDGAAVVTDTVVTLALLTTAHTDWGFKEIGNGRYRFDLPDAAFATGVPKVTIGGTFTDMVVLPVVIDLVDYDPEDATTLGLTALPNAAADAAGGLVISTIGTVDADDFALEATIGTPIDTDISTDISNISSQVGALASGSSAGFPKEFTEDNTTKDTIDAAAAVDKGDGTVGIPVTGHTFVASQEVTIAGTTNYNGAYDVVSVTANEVVITETYIAETFAGTETIVDSIKGAVFVGAITSGTLADTAIDNGTYYIINDNGTNGIDIAFKTNITGAREAIVTNFAAYLSGSNDVIPLQMYDFVNPGWEQIYSLDGQAGTTDVAESISTLARHTGTIGTDTGVVFLRWVTTGQSTPILNIKTLGVTAANTGQLGLYDGGQIFIDTIEGTDGDVVNTNGVVGSPCLTQANLNSLYSQLPYHDIRVSPESTFTSTQDWNDTIFRGTGYTFNAAGFDYAGAHIYHASPMNGIATAVNNSDHMDILDSIIDTMTLDDNHIQNSSFIGTITWSAVCTFSKIENCKSGIAGAGSPAFTKTSGGTLAFQFRNWQGSANVSGLEAGDTGTIGGTELGTITLAGTGGAVEIRGIYKEIVTTSYSGTVNLDGAMKASDLAAVKADSTSILARLGSFVGTGVNTVLGFFQSLLRSDASTPSDVGGTYNPANESLEALRARGDAAWIAATGFATPTNVSDGTAAVISAGANWVTGNTVVPDNAGIAAIQAQTDLFVFTNGNVHVDLKAWAAVDLTTGAAMVEIDGVDRRFTTKVLEQGPSGSGGDATEANQVLIKAQNDLIIATGGTGPWTEGGGAVGPGGTRVSWKVVEANTGNPIGGVNVTVFTDAAGSNQVAGPLTSGDDGYVYFDLTSGTVLNPIDYYFFENSSKHDYAFGNPTKITLTE
jgi:hypothetical protein